MTVRGLCDLRWPKVALHTGLEELAEWLANQDACDRIDAAFAELFERGLLL